MSTKITDFEPMRKELIKLREDNAALLRALKICWQSLQTYGEHPLIKNTVRSAIQKAESK